MSYIKLWDSLLTSQTHHDLVTIQEQYLIIMLTLDKGVAQSMSGQLVVLAKKQVCLIAQEVCITLNLVSIERMQEFIVKVSLSLH